jgi:hypothetical protein
MTARRLVLLAGLAGLVPAPAGAQDARAEFAHLRDGAIALLREGAEAASAEALARIEGDERARRQTRQFAYERVPALDPEGSAAAVDRASVGLGTTVEGADAGLVVSPAALAGSANPRAVAFNVFVGVLKNDETRLGVRYAWEQAAGGPGPLGLATCAFDEAQAGAWLDSIRNEYVDVCALVAASERPAGLDEGTWAIARAGCGVAGARYPKAGDRNLDVVLDQLAQAAAALRGATDEVAARRARELESAAREVGAFDPTRFLDCYGSERALAERFRIEQWRSGSRRVGVSSHLDFFPRRFGFSPDGRELPRGQVKAWHSRLDVSRQQGRVQWTLGTGVGVTRQDFKGDYAVSLTPAVAVSYMAFSLTGRSLTEEKVVEEGGRRVKAQVIRIEDGKVVPHAVLGFLVRADWSPSPPSTQETRFNVFEAQAFIEFKIREGLSFRLGVPVRGELKTRAANAQAVPPVARLSRLQWTVPVAIVTVLKL